MHCRKWFSKFILSIYRAIGNAANVKALVALAVPERK